MRFQFERFCMYRGVEFLVRFDVDEQSITDYEICVQQKGSFIRIDELLCVAEERRIVEEVEVAFYKEGV